MDIVISSFLVQKGERGKVLTANPLIASYITVSVFFNSPRHVCQRPPGMGDERRLRRRMRPWFLHHLR